MAQKHGVLPFQTLTELFDSGFVVGMPLSYINPASIDLPLSDEAYRVVDSFLPRPGESVRSLLTEVGATPHNLSVPLEVGVTYLVRVEGKVKLPIGVYGYANPKSSTGRLNLHVVLVADGVPMYDALQHVGIQGGEVWVLISPGSFPVVVSPGLALSQLRLFNGPSFLDSLEISTAIGKYGLLFSAEGRKYEEEECQRHSDSFYLSLSVKPGIIGWECRGTNRILDMSRIGHYLPEEFFIPVETRGGSVRLRAGSFYILSTEQRICVPPNFSAELRAMDPRMGEFRAHTAGYIDPGWGWGKEGEVKGRPITLEFVMFKPLMIRPGQNVVRIRYERMVEPPVVVYDAANSNYTMQGVAMLSKHFRRAV